MTEKEREKLQQAADFMLKELRIRTMLVRQISRILPKLTTEEIRTVLKVAKCFYNARRETK